MSSHEKKNVYKNRRHHTTGTKTIIINEPAWITSSLKALTGKRQKALHSGNVQEFKQLRACLYDPTYPGLNEALNDFEL